MLLARLTIAEPSLRLRVGAALSDAMVARRANRLVRVVMTAVGVIVLRRPTPGFYNEI